MAPRRADYGSKIGLVTDRSIHVAGISIAKTRGGGEQANPRAQEPAGVDRARKKARVSAPALLPRWFYNRFEQST